MYINCVQVARTLLYRGLFVGACIFPVTARFAAADVSQLEGTITAVDATARTITIERPTPKGIKTLDLKVADAVHIPRHMRVGADICFSYDSDLEVLTEITLKSIPPMPLSELVERFKVFDPPPADLKPEARQALALDQGFVLGYMVAVSEISEVSPRLPEQRYALKQYLAEHPEDASLPANVVMARVLKTSESAK
jgi:hypothetical protein